jgi:hypothetical protein
VPTDDETSASKSSSRSRRELIAGAAGAVGVLAVESLMRATPAQAADGDPLFLGFTNFSTDATEIHSSGANPTLVLEASGGDAALRASNIVGGGVLGQASGNAIGVSGFSPEGIGVRGISEGNGSPAVSGTSDNGDGVVGEGLFTGNGVHGICHDASSAGVFGENDFTGNGVHGIAHSDQGVGVFGKNDAGVAVYGASGASGAAVVGVNSASDPDALGVSGEGVVGVSGQGTSEGVSGQSADGVGVNGVGSTGVRGRPLSGGTGVVAEAAPDGSGLALQTHGPAAFSLSGVLNVTANGKSGVVTGVSLRAMSFVLATMQNDVGVSVSSAVPDVAGSKITINLSKAVPAGKTAKIAWFVVN